MFRLVFAEMPLRRGFRVHAAVYFVPQEVSGTAVYTIFDDLLVVAVCLPSLICHTILSLIARPRMMSLTHPVSTN